MSKPQNLDDLLSQLCEDYHGMRTGKVSREDGLARAKKAQTIINAAKLKWDVLKERNAGETVPFLDGRPTRELEEANGHR